MRLDFVLCILGAMLALGEGGAKAQTAAVEPATEGQLPAPVARVWRSPETGRLYWNKALPAYLFLSTSPSGTNAEKLDSRTSPQCASPFYFDTEGVNYMRTRWAVDTVTRKTITPHREVLWEVYADGIAPATQAHFQAEAQLQRNQLLYLGRGAKIALTAKDAVSGVRATYYSLNGGPFVRYEDEIVLDSSGAQELAWCSEDQVGNREQMHRRPFVLDLDAPVTSSIIHGVNLGQDNTLAASSTFMLEAKDALSGVLHTYYRIDDGKWLLYRAGTHISMRTLEDGPHAIEFYSNDRVGNKEAEDVTPFYLDKTPPIAISDVLGDRFVVGDKVFFSGRTKLKITAVDNHSGVKSVQYQVDQGAFQEYEDPFYLPNTQGWHTVRYFALDSTENTTRGKDRAKFLEYRMKVDRIYVDLTGPTIRHSLNGKSFTRNDTVFISPGTRITLSGHDAESGLKSLAYSIDEDAWEKTYEGPFDLQGLKSGEHRVEFFGYDNVGNRNIGEFSFILDSDAPEVAYEMSVAPFENEEDAEGNPVYPLNAQIFLTGQDNLTGIARLEYSLNGKAFREYRGAFGGLERGRNRLAIRVVDMVGNIREKRLHVQVR